LALAQIDSDCADHWNLNSSVLLITLKEISQSSKVMNNDPNTRYNVMTYKSISTLFLNGKTKRKLASPIKCVTANATLSSNEIGRIGHVEKEALAEGGNLLNTNSAQFGAIKRHNDSDKRPLFNSLQTFISLGGKS